MHSKGILQSTKENALRFISDWNLCSHDMPTILSILQYRTLCLCLLRDFCWWHPWQWTHGLFRKLQGRSAIGDGYCQHWESLVSFIDGTVSK